MRLHQITGDGQAQAQSLREAAFLLAAVERLKDEILFFEPDTGPCIFDLDQQFSRIDSGRNRDGPFLWRIFDGVAEQITHDLGHAPFGHTGEHVLNDLLADAGGFEHNRQSLRIVTLLEHPYPEFMGLNLMYETRLALAKHHSPYDHPEQVTFPEANCCLEGQIADVAPHRLQLPRPGRRAKGPFDFRGTASDHFDI